MREPVDPPDESERLAALRELAILDTTAEARFDRITRTAADLFGAPIALVSLVDAHRQWFKSCVGLDVSETPRGISFCGHAILAEPALVVEDATQDERFSDNPLVAGPPSIRFYAGHPVRTPNGHRVGTLCVIDPRPRRFSDQERATLAALAGWVEAELAVTWTRRAAAVIERYERFFQLSSDLFCVGDGRGMLLDMSPSFTRTLGWAADEMVGRPLLEFVHPDDLDATRHVLEAASVGPPILRFTHRFRHRDGGWRWLDWIAVPLLADDRVYAVARDVTETREAASALAASEARYRDLFENANDLIQAADGGGRFLYVNRAWRTTLGYDDRALASLTVFDVIAPEFRDHCRELFERLRGGDSLGPIEVDFLAADGRTVSLEGSVSVRVEGGEMRSTRGIFRDVSERRRIERDLAATLDLLRSVGDAQRAFIGGQGTRVAMEHLLASALRRTGADHGLIAAIDPTASHGLRPLAEVAGVDGRDVRETFAHIAVAVLQSGTRVTLRPSDLDDPTGGRAAALGLPLHVQGEMVGVLFVGAGAGREPGRPEPLEPLLSTCAALLDADRGARQREAFEQAVRDSEERLRAIIEGAVDGLVTVDDAGRVESVNPATERLFQRTSAALVGERVASLFVDTQALLPQLGGLGGSQELEVARPDGTTVTVELSISRVTLGDRHLSIGLIHDLTEHKRVERMKTEFVSTVSHELRTPLTAIRGALGLLAGDAVGELGADARAMVQVALRNSDRLVRIVNDILDVERIESGTLPLEQGPCDLGGLVAEALEAHRGFAEPLGVGLELVDEASPCQAIVDPGRMLQVLNNLLSNATKFSTAGGAVTVTVRRGAEGLCVDVADQGPGIPPEFRPRMFGRFAQADASDQRPRGGTGLGLAITRAILDRMGGRVDFTSEPGSGTTFTVTLPEWIPEPLVP